MENGECSFTFNQMENGNLDGCYKSKAHCLITGKVEGEDVVFFQNWNDLNVTIVKGEVSDCVRSMNVKFECLRSNKTENKVLRKGPARNLTGIWSSQNRRFGPFAIWTLKSGVLYGCMVREYSCRLFGRVSGHRVKFKQFWRTKRYPITSLEGFVDETGSMLILKYSYPKPDGTEEHGVTVLLKTPMDLLDSDDWWEFD